LFQSTSLSAVGDKAVTVAAARAWNSLPATVASAPSLDTFRQRLKTVLVFPQFCPQSSQTLSLSVNALFNSLYLVFFTHFVLGVLAVSLWHHGTL